MTVFKSKAISSLNFFSNFVKIDLDLHPDPFSNNLDPDPDADPDSAKYVTEDPYSVNTGPHHWLPLPWTC